MGIGQFTYCCSRLAFPATCEVCDKPVGTGHAPYYFSSPRGQTPRYRCYSHRHGRPGDRSSVKAPTAGAVPSGAKWTDPGQPPELETEL